MAGSAILSGKAALVTGAGRGIGSSLATVLAAAGATVAVHYHSSAGGAEAVVEQIRGAGGKAVAVQADLASGSDIASMFGCIDAQVGPLDILVNNAAWDPGRMDLDSIDSAFYRRIIDTNLGGAFFCIQQAARRMRGGGRIVNIGSVQSVQTVPGRTLYAACKGALEAMTRQLALELQPRGIVVNTVAPGFIEIERTRQGRPNYDREEIGRKIPSGRVGFPEDVASIVLYLVGQDPGFINGETIFVDGGARGKLTY